VPRRGISGKRLLANRTSPNTQANTSPRLGWPVGYRRTGAAAITRVRLFPRGVHNPLGTGDTPHSPPFEPARSACQPPRRSLPRSSQRSGYDKASAISSGVEAADPLSLEWLGVSLTLPQASPIEERIANERDKIGDIEPGSPSSCDHLHDLMGDCMNLLVIVFVSCSGQ
jgi:hypothetical protein